jgi:putative FmdB family regulatory protein
MPIYEYLCNNCRRLFSKLWPTIAASQEACCPHCNSNDLRRLISRVSVIKSEESRLEGLADPGKLGDLDESDPKSLGRWMRKMGQEMGEDLGDEFGEMVDRLEGGENPEDIERSFDESAADYNMTDLDE